MSLERFRVVAAAALADGKLDPRERPVLLRAARSFGLSDDQANAVFEEVAEGKTAQVALPNDPVQKKELFMVLVDLAAADGEIEKHELALFERLAPQFGLEVMEVEQILRSAESVAKQKKSKG